MVERQLPKPAELRPLIRFKKPDLNPTRRRLNAALTIADLRDIARRRTPKAAFDYTEGAAEAEISLARAREAFRDIEFHPAILQDVAKVDTSRAVLGGRVELPFGIAPTGFTRLMNPGTSPSSAGWRRSPTLRWHPPSIRQTDMWPPERVAAPTANGAAHSRVDVTGVVNVRRFGIRDVADLAGVSQGSVSHYLNHPDRVSPGMQVRIQAAIEQLGFVRNNMASQLRMERSIAIAYLAPDVTNPFFGAIAEGVEQRASIEGLSVFIVNSHHNRAREGHYLAMFEQNRVQGLLVASYESIEQRLQAIRSRGIPSVIIGKQALSEEQASISVDEVRGGYLAADHLVRSGCRRIAYVGGPMSIHQVRDRFQGATNAVHAVSGVSLEVIHVSERTIADGRRVAETLAGRPAHLRPDAIFAVNDLTALGLLQGLLANDIRVPADLSLIGYDDIEFGAASLIPLSTVRAPQAALGIAAMDLLISEMRDTRSTPNRVVMQPELVIRASSI